MMLIYLCYRTPMSKYQGHTDPSSCRRDISPSPSLMPQYKPSFDPRPEQNTVMLPPLSAY